VSRPNRDELKLLSRAVKQKKAQLSRAEDEILLARTGIRQKRLDPVFVTPPAEVLAYPRFALSQTVVVQAGTSPARKYFRKKRMVVVQRHKLQGRYMAER
jgi:hypothetical protein